MRPELNVMKLVFATNNKNKVREINALLGDKFKIYSLADINCFDEIPETADTLEGNALQKARYIAERFGYDSFADDTGLEVKSLDERPGVYTARYAGEDCTAEDNMRKLLQEMEGVADRSARFRTVIALIINGEEKLFEGAVEGTISETKSGEEGFGYDPVFIPEGHDRTFAQMDMEEKNSMSHRGRAIRKLVEYLSEKTITR